MATVKKLGGKAVSMNPDDFVAGGLPGDFNGIVTEAKAVIWNYDNGNGNGAKTDDAGNALFTLAVKTTIHREEEDDDIVNWWSAGDAKHFVPSMDGENPVEMNEDGTAEGICFIPVGSKVQLGNNTNYAQALKALRDAGWKGAFSPDVRFLEGINGHWDRVPQQKRSGIVAVPKEEGQGGRKGGNDILVLTAVKEGGQTASAPKAAPAAKSSPSATAAKSSSPAAATGTSTDLDAKLQEIVQSALPDDGTAIKKGSLAGKVMASKTLTQPEKSKGVKRITDNEFLDAGMNEDPALWLFDAETGEISKMVE